MGRWIVLVCVLLAGTCVAGSRSEVVVGFYPYPPFSYMDEEGRARGELLEIAAEVLERAGYSVRFKELPPARLFQQLATGEVQVWPGVLGGPMAGLDVLESRYRLAETRLALFYGPADPEPSLPEALSHKKVIVLRGYPYMEPARHWLQDAPLAVEQVVSNNHLSALAMLLRQRGNYMLNYLEPVNYARTSLGIGQLSMPFLPLATADLGFVVSARAGDAQQLLDAMERQLACHPMASLRGETF